MMDNDHFEKLIHGIREAGKIKRGEKQAARVFAFSPAEIKKIRNNLGLTQLEFSTIFLISIKTLQNWEQGRRYPHGPALTLLRILKKDPKRALKTLY